MVETYAVLKFIHILIAIIALGSSAGLGILLELYGDDESHGLFVLRAIRRILYILVVPGHLLMAITGLWLANVSWSLTTHWIQAALVFWLLGFGALVAHTRILRRQIETMERDGPASPRYRRLSLGGRALGATSGLAVILIVWMMVLKPALPFW